MEVILKKIKPEERAVRIARQKVISADERRTKPPIKAMTADVKAIAARA
jgi:hypothetical protein